jgi:hypothetical protein
LYEQQLSYVEFVDQWILRIEDFQIMANGVLNITNICTNLLHSQLGIENIEMLISTYKNWPNKAHETIHGNEKWHYGRKWGINW